MKTITIIAVGGERSSLKVELYSLPQSHCVGALNAGRVHPMLWQPLVGVVVDISTSGWPRKQCVPIEKGAIVKEFKKEAEARSVLLSDLTLPATVAESSIGAIGSDYTGKSATSSLYPLGSIESTFLQRDDVKTVEKTVTALVGDKSVLSKQLATLKKVVVSKDDEISDVKGQLESSQATVEQQRILIASDSRYVDAVRQRDHWQRQYDDADRKKKATLATLDLRERTIHNLESELKKLTDERHLNALKLEEANTRITTLEIAATPKVQQRDIRKIDAMQTLLRGLLPRVNFDEESWDTIFRYCQNPVPLVRVLQKLSAKGLDLASHSLPNTTWRETTEHISNGQDSRLRVYWTTNADKSLLVKVYYKISDENQEQFHRTLKSIAAGTG